ncbi:MAG: hypothetical protein U9P42_03035 [Candidatus Fermentibacteria bacterium]|nr:hypothetical protein [Candidatus Fermentibacteria bacterium]
MNSWGNDRLEEKIDEMLTSSVSRGSEPRGFSVRFMPRRPLFPWIYVIYVLAAAAVLGFFMTQWLNGQDFENVDYVSVFSFERLSGLFSGITIVGLMSGLAIILGLGGAILTFLPEKQQGLRHLL